MCMSHIALSLNPLKGQLGFQHHSSLSCFNLVSCVDLVPNLLCMQQSNRPNPATQAEEEGLNEEKVVSNT